MRLPTIQYWTLLVFLLGLTSAYGYFGFVSHHANVVRGRANSGLTAWDPMLSHSYNFENNYIDDGRGNRGISSTKLCEMMNLHKKQKRMCRRGRGVARTLLDAIELSVMECQFQFQNERWNCSLTEPHRRNLLKKGFKETSFLYAMSSASLVHEFARACSSGRLDRCTCDESQSLQNKEAWRWGGCGDNVKYGFRFTRRFLRRARRRGKDHRAMINQHNSKLGIRVVRSNVNTTCKCHGVSGSCTVRTCWQQLSPFHKIGNILKRKYERAVKVEIENNISYGKYELPKGEISNAIRPSPFLSAYGSSMVYMDDSPSYCSRSRYSQGTTGRECDKDRNCDAICCGRGYNVQTKAYNRSCACQVVWCCDFHCKQCLFEEEVHLCK
ncbi:protein Wnt-9a-like isoform X1 [Ylistrum balloti]|uniref:protein Wnt-9a-like isoform X1 n=1 Tax=Ylistrum balloti TaxID=509963 RepID=UPI002905C5AB|nr:protein Wnt-9a-like isoform X1 [Ylistrum balloti]